MDRVDPAVDPPALAPPRLSTDIGAAALGAHVYTREA